MPVLMAPVVALAVIALATLLLTVQRAHQARLVGRVVTSEPGREHPTLLYFTGEHCSICHTAQRPAVERLRQRVGPRATIREVDVAADPALARRYRVMSLPTTIVLDPRGAVASVNIGFTGDDALERQLAAAARDSGATAGMRHGTMPV